MRWTMDAITIRRRDHPTLDAWKRMLQDALMSSLSESAETKQARTSRADSREMLEADLAQVKAWFGELARHVQAVDFAAARHLFVEDFVAFGTFTNFVVGREPAERDQWRKVWPTIDGFAWRLDDAKALLSPDRLFAVGLAVFDSTGYHQDGRLFERSGRATVSLTRARIGDPFVANHTHMSLFRGTPDVSHGNKPSKS
jgi:ketosteroid isomerase-like protein